jgi:hypothetical protein
MPTIFAIDGAEFGDLEAASPAIVDLQVALVALGKGAGDNTLKAIVVDGLIGPKTTAATNRAFTVHIGAGQAAAEYRTGALTQSEVAALAARLAEIVNGEVQRRGYGASTSTVIATVVKATTPKTTALVPYQASAAAPKAAAIAPTYIPAPADTGMQAAIIKWSAIGLGLVIATAGIYYAIRRRGQPALAGCDLGMKGDRINDHERELWIQNDEGLYNWYQRESRHAPGGMRAFIKRHKAEIDGIIRGVVQAPPRQSSIFFGAGRRHAVPKGPASAFDVTVWEERDRLHIGITKDGAPVDVDWWDDDAREMFEDGFFKSGRNLKSSVIDYAKEHGLIRVT